MTLRTEVELTAAPSVTKEAKKSFWAKCQECAHCWIVAYLPMDVATFARIGTKATCPMCGSRKAFIAKQNDGVLQEEGQQ